MQMGIVGDFDKDEIIVIELIDRFWIHGNKHYRKSDGTPTSEIHNYQAALKLLKKLYGQLPVKEFSPLKLKAVRQQMIDMGWSRKNINIQTGLHIVDIQVTGKHIDIDLGHGWNPYMGGHLPRAIFHAGILVGFERQPITLKIGDKLQLAQALGTGAFQVRTLDHHLGGHTVARNAFDMDVTHRDAQINHSIRGHWHIKRALWPDNGIGTSRINNTG